MVDPETCLRRTPLRRLLDAHDAAWRALADTAVAETIPPADTPGTLAIADLSPLPRLGFKGPGTIPAMKARGLVLEAVPNRAYRQADGGLCLVLAASEVVLLSDLQGNGARLAELETGWRLDDEERTYPVRRRDSHAWLMVTGADLPEFFAKICAVDMRPAKFPDLAIAQTSVARLTAIVTRADMGRAPAFHILADSASALYFCSCLLDAAREFGGRMIGLNSAIRQKIDDEESMERP